MILRPYQENVKQRIYDEWGKGHKNVLLVLPTGLGKTAVLTTIAIDKSVLPHNKIVTAIVVHRKELVQQISLTLAEQGVSHNIMSPRPVILGIIAAQRKLLGKQFYDHNAPISVISVDTLNARISKFTTWAKSVGLWITDEAAHLLRENKWGRAVSYFPNAIGLGVTATPERLDKKGLGSHVDGVFDVMVEGPPSRWGIENKYLSKYKVAIPKGDFEEHLHHTGKGDYTTKEMEDATKKSRIVGDAVENYIKYAAGKQAILFAPSISLAHDYCSEFEQGGIPAQVLTGNSTDAERLQGMIDFRDKKTKVLINVDLFDEGLDVPGIEAVIMTRPTMSLGKYLQQIGRGLRPAKDKDFLIIIDHVGNFKKHGAPCDKRKWTLDRIAKKKKSFSLIKICDACMSPFERALSECPWCGEPATKGGGGGERVPPEMVDGDLELIDPMSLREMYAKSILEDPASMSQRVGYAAGPAAAAKVMKTQTERINIQSQLKDKIAKWAGFRKDEGLSDREIHKAFFIEFNQTIAQALSEPKDEMLEMVSAIDELLFKDVVDWNKTIMTKEIVKQSKMPLPQPTFDPKPVRI
jgi:superfamily II DNA or RNA helicase